MQLAEAAIERKIQDAMKTTGPLAPIAPEIDRLLAPNQPVADVLASLDRQYQAEGKPEIYFLPADQPITPHLASLLTPAQDVPGSQVRTSLGAADELATLPLNQPSAPLLDQMLGPAPPVDDVLKTLDQQYRSAGKPPVWFLPLDQPIAPHLVDLLDPPLSK
jgi:hypothetical protein